nr:hypothetical protein [Tanacetum cinerariifolium]
MDITIDQQVALDEALVPHASQLKIGKTDVPEICMKMMHICPIIPNQPFDELPFEQEILAFLINLGHSGEIKKITDNTQQFGAIFLVELTNEDIRNSAASKEYSAIALGAEPPKTKASVRKTQSSSDTTIPPSTAAGTRLSTSAKGKQPAKTSKAKGLYVLSEVALTEAEQMKLVTKRSLQQNHISQASGPSTDEGTGIIPGVPDVPTYESDEEISWKSSDEDDDDDDIDDQNNDDDDFVHPKLTTHDEEAKDEESFDPIVQTQSHVTNSDDEGNDDASHGMNVGSDEGPDVEDDYNELYGDININLEGRDVQMTDVYTTKVLEDTHVTLTSVNPDGQQQSSSVSSQFVSNMLNPDAGIDSLFESTPRVDVPVMTTAESLLLTAPTLPPPSIPIISQVQQAPTPSLVTAPSTSLQDLLSFDSLFGFDHRLKTLEANFSEFMQKISLLKPSLLFSVLLIDTLITG